MSPFHLWLIWPLIFHHFALTDGYDTLQVRTANHFKMGCVLFFRPRWNRQDQCVRERCADNRLSDCVHKSLSKNKPPLWSVRTQKARNRTVRPIHPRCCPLLCHEQPSGAFIVGDLHQASVLFCQKLQHIYSLYHWCNIFKHEIQEHDRSFSGQKLVSCRYFMLSDISLVVSQLFHILNADSWNICYRKSKGSTKFTQFSLRGCTFLATRSTSTLESGTHTKPHKFMKMNCNAIWRRWEQKEDVQWHDELIKLTFFASFTDWNCWCTRRPYRNSRNGHKGDDIQVITWFERTGIFHLTGCVKK